MVTLVEFLQINFKAMGEPGNQHVVPAARKEVSLWAIMQRDNGYHVKQTQHTRNESN